MHHFSRKTKIVATIGPGSESKEQFTRLLRAGVNVARTNMSHDDQAVHQKRIETIRAVSKKEKIPVAVLFDLSGPKIRIGDFAEGVVTIEPGEWFILSAKPCAGDASKVHFPYPEIVKELKRGQVLMLDDGRKQLVVEKIVRGDVHTIVRVGGSIKSRRGVNIPGAYLSISALTDKDKKDLVFGVKMDVDYMALSFVRTAKDVEYLRSLIKKHKGHQAIISKVETEEAVQDIDNIIAASDAIMVARGDLAIEIGAARVPSVQKMIIQKCNDAGKPVIVATQMLESMINSSTPTRAEVSDVANAIFDGADAVMLSEETALGKYALEAIQTMNGVALQVEGDIGTHRRYKVHTNSVVDSVSSSVVHNAEDVLAKAIVTLTESGFTPRMISRYKPQQPVFALTPHERVARKLQLVYGCYPAVTKPFQTIAQISGVVEKLLLSEKLVTKGDRVVLAAGVPFNVAGTTNMMMILPIA
jgi:pyruvate kinase